MVTTAGSPRSRMRRLLRPLPRAEGVREHGDGPEPLPQLPRYLDDLERLNAWFGGYALTTRAIEQLARRAPGRGAFVVADVGGARGDLAVRLVRRARRQRRPVRVIVLDSGRATVALGRRATRRYPEIAWVQAEATALPLRERAVDVAVAALTLHHLEPPAGQAMLAAMRRAARLGVVVNDLRRTRLARLLVTVATRLFASHPSSRHDGPLSVTRAYAPAELRALAARAGFTRLRVRQHRLLARVLMVAS